MLKRAAISLLTLCLALPSHAQTPGESRWSLYSATDRSDIIARASICPLLDTEMTGNYFCVSLGCGTGSNLQWRVEFAGAGEVPDQVVVQISVDGLTQTGIPMSRLPDAGGMGYATAYDPNRDATIVAALARGTTGRIDFDTRALNGRAFALAGAAAALQATLAQCAAPAAAAASAAATTPRDAALTEIARGCGVAPAQLRIAPGFETIADITGDGREDVILNYGAVACPATGLSQYCGSGGCTHAIWASQTDGSLRQVFSDTIYGMTAGWMPVLTIDSHGSACGRTGASGPCTRSFRIAPDGTLTLLD